MSPDAMCRVLVCGCCAGVQAQLQEDHHDHDHHHTGTQHGQGRPAGHDVVWKGPLRALLKPMQALAVAPACVLCVRLCVC